MITTNNNLTPFLEIIISMLLTISDITHYKFSFNK